MEVHSAGLSAARIRVNRESGRAGEGLIVTVTAPG